MPVLICRDFKITGRKWGAVTLEQVEDQRFQVRRVGFTSNMTAGVPEADVPRLTKIIEAEDWRALYEYNFELIPWYRPTCAEFYSNPDWRLRDVFDEDGWHDSIRGMCRRGHDRMLED